MHRLRPDCSGGRRGLRRWSLVRLEAERAVLAAERVLNRRSDYLADPLGQALVVGDDGAGPHRRPGLAVSRAVVGQAFLDDLEPHPVADVESCAEPLGDLGQSLWGMNISSPTDHFLYSTILASFLVRPGAPGRIRTCDTRFRKSDEVAGCGRHQATRLHEVFLRLLWRRWYAVVHPPTHSPRRRQTTGGAGSGAWHPHRPAGDVRVLQRAAELRTKLECSLSSRVLKFPKLDDWMRTGKCGIQLAT